MNPLLEQKNYIREELKGISRVNRNKGSVGRLRLIPWIGYKCNINSDLIEFSRYYLYFMLYSFLGWIWETIFILIMDGTFQERGFLHIPICSIYGFGVLLILFLFYKKTYPWTTIFLCSVFTTCVLEFLTSWEMERLFHKTWWDYSCWIFNFQGRISLLTSLAFGIVSLLVVNWIHPLLCRVFDKYFRLGISLKVCIILFTITIIDFIFTTIMLL